VAPTKRAPIFRSTSEQVKREGAKTTISEIGSIQPNQSLAFPPQETPAPLDVPPSSQQIAYAPDPSADYWQKITIAFRREQVEELQKILRTWELNEGVTITLVEMARLATDDILQAAKSEKEAVWIKVKKQAEREHRENPKSKHSKSKALKIRIR